MYGIARIGAELERPLDEMLRDIVELLPPAWQYPEITTARIVLEDNVYDSHDFAEGPLRISSELRVGGSPCGRVESKPTKAFARKDGVES